MRGICYNTLRTADVRISDRVVTRNRTGQSEGVPGLEVFRWIEQQLTPQPCSTDVLIYDDMDSQSGYSLPIIYQPFDGTKESHWADRGATYDFLDATGGENQTLLDFGPGDGWPSLLVAPFSRKVVGLDSSRKRVKVCRENARRLGITNADFISYEASAALPLRRDSFDGITAASSVEQAPDPRGILAEFHRILRPGGRLRICYEDLARYQEGRQQTMWISDLDQQTCKILLYDRNIPCENVIQYAITLAMPRQELLERLGSRSPTFCHLTLSLLKQVEPMVVKTRRSRTIHPSGKTWAHWLKDLGFSQVMPTHSGKRAAIAMYRWFSDAKRPRNMADVDDTIRPAVRLAVNLECPLELNPHITAVK